jgi:hypothetical protein
VAAGRAGQAIHAAVQERGVDTKGKALGEKLGNAMADSSLESGASGTMGRPGMVGYLTAGLAVVVAVGGLNMAI